MEYVYEFHLRADAETLDEPIFRSSRVDRDDLNSKWSFEGVFEHKPSETFARCGRRKAEGEKGYFIRAYDEEEARQKLAKLPEPETFFIA